MAGSKKNGGSSKENPPEIKIPKTDPKPEPIPPAKMPPDNTVPLGLKGSGSTERRKMKDGVPVVEPEYTD